MVSPNKKIRLGTRGSPLAIIQANLVKDLFENFYPDLLNTIEIIVIKTTGDKILDTSLSEIGGKALFTKEIDNALKSNHIDIAVHSLKDVETKLPEGLICASVLNREDPRDCVVSSKKYKLEDLPYGAVVGTSSPRRRAQILEYRPDINIKPIRGNVRTRIDKVYKGDFDATLLAYAGLKRLGFESEGVPIDLELLLPAVSQGAICIQAREKDSTIRKIISTLSDKDTFNCVTSERAMLDALGGSCRTPIAALATCEHDKITLNAKLYSINGNSSFHRKRTGLASDAEKIGKDLGLELRSTIPESIIDSWL